MNFELNKSLEILERTPLILERMVNGLSEEWVISNEGDNTWNTVEIIGHLIHGEKTDWIPRILIILNDENEKTFEVFNMEGHKEEIESKRTAELLDEFKALRIENIRVLRYLDLTDDDLNKTGLHPVFGEVTLRQLLSTWTVHDLTHISQISRIMAKQYREEIGPWIEFFNLIK
ncbi:MAG TPA: DinB family protein [Ignavibacteria bacterium]|nr:DinB family protein [Ignavibacteria bacterium]